MKIGAAAAVALFALALLSGCPKSNNMLDHSRKPGALQQPKPGAAPDGELTKGTPPPGTATPPAAGGDAGSNGSSSGGDTGGGDTGGDDESGG